MNHIRENRKYTIRDNSDDSIGSMMPETETQRTAILVIGMHRSGTSALTRVINLLGADLPADLLPPQDDNKTGFWESVDVCQLNEEILVFCGSCWHQWKELDLTLIRDSAYSEFKSQAIEFVQNNFKGSSFFVLKDPRFCLLLPFWIEVFNECNVQVKCVLPIRNPLEVASSLKKRDGFSRKKSNLLWLRYVLAAEMWTRELPRVFVTYHELLADWEGTCRNLSRELEFTWPRSLDEARSDIAGFLDCRHRHHVFDDTVLREQSLVDGWAHKVFFILTELCNNQKSKRLMERIDFIRGEFAWASNVFFCTCGDESNQLCSEERENVKYSLDEYVSYTNKIVKRLEKNECLLHTLRENNESLLVQIEYLKMKGNISKNIINNLENNIIDNDSNLTILQEKLDRSESELLNILNSSSWKITRPMRWARRLLIDPYRWFPVFLSSSKKRLVGGRVRINEDDVHVNEDDVHVSLGNDCPNDDMYNYHPPSPLDNYSSWIMFNSFNEKVKQRLTSSLRRHVGKLPKISVITPVYNTPAGLLLAAVQSVLDQVYSNWELCLADDGSTEKGMPELLEEISRKDERIKIIYCQENGGISHATNAAVSIATGEILAFLDHDDLLAQDALGEVALYYASHADTDIVYSDDDKIDLEGKRFSPQFKPDWSPILLLSYMYMSHLFTVRKKLFLKLGGFLSQFDGSQDYEFALRASEHARHVGHIPKILYHWRVVPGSTAEAGDAKPASFEAGRLAVTEALKRRGWGDAVVTHPAWASSAKVGMFSISFPVDGPTVSILIPTRNNHKMLQSCLDSIWRTTYRNYEVIVVDNDSDDPECLQYLERINNVQCRVVSLKNEREKFSYANLMNRASKESQADYLLFLNDDTKVITEDWLSQMVGYIKMQGVGAVGAQLLFEDGTIQHSGIIHGLYNGMAGPAFRCMPSSDWGYLGYLKVVREYSAVTAACLLTSRELFAEFGGFDEDAFSVAYNDVDYCYRLVDQGYSCICCSTSRLFHYEGKSRGFNDDPREIARFRKKYLRRVDKFYNVNLSLANERFEIKSSRIIDPICSAPIKTVMLTHNLNHEGAPNSMFELVVGLCSDKIIDPVVLSPVDGPLRNSYEREGITVEIISNPLELVEGPEAFQSNLLIFRDKILEFGAELVYANTLQAFWGILAATMGGVPSVWNVRESESWEGYFNYLPSFMRDSAYSAFRYAYKVVFVANATCQVWTPLNYNNNFEVIPNGLDRERLYARSNLLSRNDARRLLGIAEDELMVLLLGTVCERKGQVDFVKAIARLPENIWKRLRFYIVGDREGAYSTSLHEQVASLPSQLRSRLLVFEETGSPYVYFQAADVSVCTSYIESYPRVILEAMAFGLPIITTPVFGIVEQVMAGVNALIYPPGDSARLSEAIVRVVEDDSLREKYAENSKYVLDCLVDFSEMKEKYGHVFCEATYCSPPGPFNISEH